MILYPSIHLKDGAVARLIRAGDDFSDTEILHENPVERAVEFEAQGFSWLHLVDIDGAFQAGGGAGGINDAVIRDIVKTVKFPVQLSGGLHDMAAIERWIDCGVARVVLSSAAVQSPELVAEACKRYPGRVAVKIDSRAGYVITTGWKKASNIKALDLALRMEEAGAATIIYADINPDGALSEVNLEAIVDLAFALTVPVIVSGGIHALDEVIELKSHSAAGIKGLILGRMLYHDDFDVQAALAAAAE